MVFLYILVLAFYVFKTVKVSVTAERNWGDVNLLIRVGMWLMLRKMCSYYKHSKDMIRIVDVGFFWHNLWRLHCLCDIFLTWDMFAFSLLFYGKYYVTMFIREYVAFSYCYWGKFLPKQNEKKLSRIIFFHRKRRFLFFFSFVSRIDFFFWAFLSATFYIFFWSSMTWRILLVLRFTFFS